VTMRNESGDAEPAAVDVSQGDIPAVPAASLNGQGP
jgi:hypothetical protein